MIRHLLYAGTLPFVQYWDRLLEQDNFYVRDASLLPHDAVGWQFNPGNDVEDNAVGTYEATLDTAFGDGPSMLRSNSVEGTILLNFQLEQMGVVMEGQQTTDGEGAVDGYILETQIPWAVAMEGAAGGDSYVPTPGDEHGLSFLLAGWNGFDNSTPSSSQNHKGLFVDYGFGQTTHNFNPADPLIDPKINIFDQNLWNLITLVAAGTPGDFDNDGDVDGFDFLKWQRGESPNPFSQSDLADWQDHFGNVGLSSASTSIPEPATISLLMMAGLIWRRRGGFHSGYLD